MVLILVLRHCLVYRFIAFKKNIDGRPVTVIDKIGVLTSFSFSFDYLDPLPNILFRKSLIVFSLGDIL